MVNTSRRRTASALCAAILFTVLLAACSTAPVPLRLTYPHPWVDYDAIDGLDEIASGLSPYFVKVFIYDAYNAVDAVGVGSGIIVDEIGHVITAAHIVKRQEHRAFVKNMSGSTLPARIVHVDPERELALLRISIRDESIGEPPATGEPVPGQSVFAIGTQPDFCLQADDRRRA